MEFRLSMAFVVYITRRVSEENLKIGEMASQFLYHDFIELGYFCCHFSAARSSSPKASSSFGAPYILRRSFVNALRSLSLTYFSVFLT